MIVLNKGGIRVKLIDELYEAYKDKLTGDEEDADIIAHSVIEELNSNDLISLLKELPYDELAGLVGFYISGKIKRKMAKDGLGHTQMISTEEFRRLH